MTPEQLTQAREQLGLSQAEIARQLGVNVVTWNRWEKGRQQVRYPIILSLALWALARQKRGR